MILTVTRALCTGSRDLSDEEGRLLVDRTLDDVFREAKTHLHILVGDCRTGADRWVWNWARHREDQEWPVSHEVFVAHWSVLGRSAGPKRNAAMVAAGADLALAFYAPPPALNRGTSGCVRLARAAGIPVREYGLENHATSDHRQETLPL